MKTKIYADAYFTGNLTVTATENGFNVEFASAPVFRRWLWLLHEDWKKKLYFNLPTVLSLGNGVSLND